MSERARKLLIVAGVVIVLGGPAVYFFGVHQPAQARGEARREIAAWEARWTQARGCIVGSAQASSVVREAIAVHELGAAVAVPTTCMKVMGELTRGPGDATAVDAVERAWQAIDTAAGTLARTYLTYRDRVAKPGRDRLDEIARALTAMDDAHATLRAAAGMAALPPRAPSALPAIARATPLARAQQPLARVERMTLSSGTLIVHAAGARERAVAVIAPGKPPLVMALDRAVRSLPDLGWGALGSERGLELGALDETGRLATATATAIVPATTWTKSPTSSASRGSRARVPATTPTVVLALGNATQGIVVATEPIAPDDEDLVPVPLRVRELRIEGGKVVSSKVREVQELQSDVDHAGRAILAWVDRAGGVAATTLAVDSGSANSGGGRGGRGDSANSANSANSGGSANSANSGGSGGSGDHGDHGDYEVGGSPPDTQLAAHHLGPGDRGCHTVRSGWMHAGQQLVELRAGALPRELVDHALVGCGRDAVLLRARGASRFAVCTAEACRTAELASAHPGAVPVLVGDRVVALAAYDRVVGIWSEGAPARFVTLAAPLAPLHAVSDGTTIDVLGATPDGLAIIRIPAR